MFGFFFLFSSLTINFSLFILFTFTATVVIFVVIRIMLRAFYSPTFFRSLLRRVTFKKIFNRLFNLQGLYCLSLPVSILALQRATNKSNRIKVLVFVLCSTKFNLNLFTILFILLLIIFLP